MYKIIGADGKQYGPISGDQIRQWISEGRANGQTQVCAEGSEDWKPLSAFPEFGFTAAPTTAVGAESTAPDSPEEILARDYTLDIGGCIAQGWRLFKDQFATVFVTFLLFVLLVIAASGAIQIVFAIIGVNRMPLATKMYLNPILVCFNTLVMGPAAGGLYQVYLSAIRGRPTGPADLFQGFKMFQDLFLGKLIPSLIISAIVLPANIFYAAKAGPFFDRLQQNPQSVNPQEIFPQSMAAFSSTFPAFLICLIPITYLSVNWMFTLPLIIDKKMGFWTAMKVSWKMVHRHWLHVFGLVVLVGLINIAGLCACCIGLLVTLPIGMAAMMYAYETIFGRKTA